MHPDPAQGLRDPPAPDFAPFRDLSGRNRLYLAGSYYDSGFPPYNNCITLMTPVATEDPHSGKVFPYRGWEFGDQIPGAQFGPSATTAPILPTSLKRGRTYRFRVRKVLRLHDTQHYVMDDNGGTLGLTSGPESPGGSLGSGRSIVDTLSYEIVIKRVR